MRWWMRIRHRYIRSWWICTPMQNMPCGKRAVSMLWSWKMLNSIWTLPEAIRGWNPVLISNWRSATRVANAKPCAAANLWAVFYHQRKERRERNGIFGNASIPAIFVSYPNPKLKRFQKEPTTIYSVLPFSDWVIDCAWQTYSFLAFHFVYIACLSLKWQKTVDCVTKYLWKWFLRPASHHNILWYRLRVVKRGIWFEYRNKFKTIKNYRSNNLFLKKRICAFCCTQQPFQALVIHKRYIYRWPLWKNCHYPVRHPTCRSRVSRPCFLFCQLRIGQGR